MSEQRALNNYDALKLFALLTMTVDHVGYYLVAHEELLRLIGRLAMPAFCFLVGYNRHYKYREELFWVALFITFAAFMRHDFWRQNILWAILLTRWLLAHVSLNTWRRAVIPMGILALPLFVTTNLFLDYGNLVLLWALAGRFRAEAPERWEGKAYLWLALGVTIFVTWDIFVQHTLGGVLATAALLALGWYLRGFTITPWAVPNGLQPVARFFSENALYYYGVHVIVLATIGYAYGITP